MIFIKFILFIIIMSFGCLLLVTLIRGLFSFIGSLGSSKKFDERGRYVQYRQGQTGAKRECEYCLKDFKVPSLENSWDKSFVEDTYYCCKDCLELHNARKKRESEIKWIKDHTMTCAWCDTDFFSYERSRYCSNERCQSERRIHEKIHKGK